MHDRTLAAIKWILDEIDKVFPRSPLDSRHAIMTTDTGRIELVIWFEGERFHSLIGDEVQSHEIPELLEHIKVDYIEQIRQRLAPKQFKIVSVSQNANDFGLHGHILLARDGECWEVARNRTGPHEGEWNKGEMVTIHKRSKEQDDYRWAEAGCEIPTRRRNAPPAVVAEAFPPTPTTKTSTDKLT